DGDAGGQRDLDGRLAGCGAGDLTGGGDDVGVGGLPGDRRGVGAARRQVEVAADVVDVVDDEGVGRRLRALLVLGEGQHGDLEGLLAGEPALAERGGEGGRGRLLPRRRSRHLAVGRDDGRVGRRPGHRGAAGAGRGQGEVTGDGV